MPKKPLALLLVTLTALLSLNCGIVALPIEGPKVILRNAKTLDFTVDIRDPAGKPLDNVTITATRYAYRVDPIFSTVGEEKTDPPKTVNGSFTLKIIGKYAVAIEYAKPGYLTQKVLYGLEDPLRVPPSGFFFSHHPLTFTDRINITADPHSILTLTPGEGASPISELERKMQH